MRIVSLNLNHRTIGREVPRSLIDAIGSLEPDVLFFNEFVSGPKNQDLSSYLSDIGLRHTSSSYQVVYSPGRYHNQILVASNRTLHQVKRYHDGPDAGANSNILSVVIDGISMTGMRAPAYKTMSEWRKYWAWLSTAVAGDVLIGDLNVDPERGRPRDKAYEDLVSLADWTLASVSGDWSFSGVRGNQAKLDHVLVRNGIQAENARYVQTPFVPTYTDHAALCVELPG